EKPRRVISAGFFALGDHFLCAGHNQVADDPLMRPRGQWGWLNASTTHAHPTIAYKLGQFQPNLLEVWLTARRYSPSEVNRVHEISSGCG
ncbi:hypothetical protein, partial [Massilia brevitalea]|uniref:hypothetical protein n=1 Tax=Massilia brevitalea TaxID=442526 RepID=UPI002738ECD1